MTTSNTQQRGHCQCCGNQQAVLKSGNMSKHGYTVDHGWFNGVCQGERFVPIEKDRSTTDSIVADIRRQVAELRETVKNLQDGKVFPKECRNGRYVFEGMKRVAVIVPFKEADKYHQDAAVKEAIWNTESRAKQGDQFADYLTKIADQYHGKELMQVERKAAAKHIQKGERKTTEKGDVIIALYQDGARVYYYYKGDTTPLNDGSGKVKVNRKYWIGTQAWRKLNDVV